MRKFLFILICMCFAPVNADRVNIMWGDSYHELETANSNTPESTLNAFSFGYYSLFHDNNEIIHIEFYFNETVHDVHLWVIPYDSKADLRVTQYKDYKHYPYCIGNLVYTYENNGFPKESKGVYLIFSYKINSTQYEHTWIKAHNGLDISGFISGDSKYSPVGAGWDLMDAAFGEDSSPEKDPALEISGEVEEVITGNQDKTDSMQDKLDTLTDDLVENNPLTLTWESLKGMKEMIEAWNNIYDLLTTPEGRIFELVCTLFIALGVMLIIYQGRYFIGIFLILLCGIPMFTSDQTVLGNLLGGAWNELFS